jgi:hypothetical protein
MLSAKYLFMKMLFGKYSYIFHNFLNKTGHAGTGKKNYLQACSKLSALNHYHTVVAVKKETAVFETTKKIEFQDTPFNQSFRRIRRQKRKHSCYDINKYQDHYWRRLGYRERIFNAGVRMVYHFIDKRFFFGEIFFSDASKVNTDTIALSLLKKYTDQKSAPETNFKISGKDAFIFFENTGINLSIKYIFTGNTRINEALDSIISSIGNIKVEKVNNELEELL